MIRHFRLSIHDLSRLKAARARELYRMNMPFELGIDDGSRQHGLEYMQGKKFLILEKEQHDFKKALSNMAGVDIKSHGDELEPPKPKKRRSSSGTGVATASARK